MLQNMFYAGEPVRRPNWRRKWTFLGLWTILMLCSFTGLDRMNSTLPKLALYIIELLKIRKAQMMKWFLFLSIFQVRIKSNFIYIHLQKCRRRSL